MSQTTEIAIMLREAAKRPVVEPISVPEPIIRRSRKPEPEPVVEPEPEYEPDATDGVPI